MKNCAGVWLPDSEEKFVAALTTPSKGLRMVDGLPAYGYEQLERAVKLCRRRRRAVDIGAHVGMWSMWLVREFEHLDAFEPVREYADIFPRNVPGENWTLHQMALGEAAGRVAMKEYPGNTGQAHVAGDGEIEMRTLDSFYFSDVDLVKIDVEGYELQVVRGATRTLLECRPIVVLEQRGCEVVNFKEKERDAAIWWLERGLGMRRIECIHYDWIMGWK